jgi:hypothetical protein
MGRVGINLDVAFKKEVGARSVVDIVAATDDQGFPPVNSPTSGHHHQPPEKARLPSSVAGEVR